MQTNICCEKGACLKDCLQHNFDTSTWNVYSTNLILLQGSTRGDQKVRGKVLLNRIAFIDCNENS